MNNVKFVHPVTFLLAALIGVGAGACKASDMRIERVCKRHCSAMRDCSNIDYDNCVNDCIETANECDSDADVEMALDRLDECKKEQCGELVGCGIDAWVECKL